MQHVTIVIVAQNWSYLLKPWEKITLSIISSRPRTKSCSCQVPLLHWSIIITWSLVPDSLYILCMWFLRFETQWVNFPRPSHVTASCAHFITICAVYYILFLTTSCSRWRLIIAVSLIILINPPKAWSIISYVPDHPWSSVIVHNKKSLTCPNILDWSLLLQEPTGTDGDEHSHYWEQCRHTAFILEPSLPVFCPLPHWKYWTPYSAPQGHVAFRHILFHS